MPSTTEHTARISDPSKYDKFRRENDKFGKGIDVVWGILSNGKTEVQSIRFDANKFTSAEARKWLKDHDYKPLEFVAASDDKAEYDDECEDDKEKAMPKNKDDNSDDEEDEDDNEEDDDEDDEKSSNSKIEHKTFRFSLSSAEETKSSTGNYGIIKGYASTFGNVDRGNDIVMKGAFVKSIDDYRKRNKMIPMCYQHSMMHPIGGFSPSKMYEDDKGLYVEGEINLSTEKGTEAYALAKQGVLTDMSIGFTCSDKDYETSSKNDAGMIRKIKEVQLWEISMVVVPMNPLANITDVKGATPFQDYPIADKDTKWDADAAIGRIRKFTKSADAPSSYYKKAFMWYDESAPDNFTSYKLPYVDVIGGKMKVIPRAIYAIAQVLSGGRGGVDIPAADKVKVKSHVNKYYAAMNMESPLKGLAIDGVMTIEDLSPDDLIQSAHLQTMRKSEIEKVLRETGRFSRGAAKFIVSCLHFPEKENKIKQESNLDKNDLSKLLTAVQQRDAVQQNKIQSKNINLDSLKDILAKVNNRKN